MKVLSASVLHKDLVSKAIQTPTPNKVLTFNKPKRKTQTNNLYRNNVNVSVVSGVII